MKCPTCKNPSLVMSERQGIEIDYCPECRGIWLDRGELDKILERARAEEAPQPKRDAEPRIREPAYREEQAYSRSQEGYYKYKRKKSFLEDLFD